MSVSEPFRGSFVGREGDVAAIEATLANGARLVTVLGPGGVGKTRLLHRVLAHLGRRHGAPTVNLAALYQLAPRRPSIGFHTAVDFPRAVSSGLPFPDCQTRREQQHMRALCVKARCGFTPMRPSPPLSRH